MTKLPKIGGQRLSGVTESNNIQVKGKSEYSKKEKKRFVRRVGKRGTEDLGAKENVVPEVSTPDVLLEESPADEFFSPDMSGWDMSNASTALDRLHMSDQQRKQLEIATNLEMIHQRVRQVLENGGVSPDLNMDAVDFNRPPAYMEENTEIDKFKNGVDEMLHLLHKQEVTKSAIIRDVDEFFGFASDDQSEPLCKAFENIEIDEKMAHEGVEQVGEAFRYTEELTDKIQVCWLRAMREAGFIDTSSDEEEGEEGGVNVQGIKGAKEMKMFSNPAAFGINTNMLIKSLEEMIRLVKGRSKKDQVKQLVKQYKAQVKVTELWLDDLGKHNEENASLNQQVKELKKSRDQANKAKEELDLKKRFFERKKNEMEKENQLLKATNEKLSTRNRKLETEVSRLQDKLDSVEDEAMIAKEFGGRKTDEDDRKAAGSRVPDEATKQYIQNLKTEIANLEQVIAANNSKMTALEKELITERGNITRLKHELSLASRASAVSPSKEEDKRKNSAVQTSNTTETNMTDDSKISEIKDDFQKAKLEINELKMELDRKTMEIQNLEKQTKELRKELMSVFDVGGDENTTPEQPPPSEEEGETDAIPKNPVQNQTSTEQKKMVPASQLASLRRVMRAMTVDHQTEIKKLITHLENEKSRTEASLRKQEQSHKEQLLNVHKQAVHILRMINRFKLAISSVLEKEMVMTAADNVRKIPDLNTEEVPADTKEMLNLMAAQASSVFMGIENNIHQAFLSIRLENKDKISANQVIQHNLKNQALQANKQLKGIEHMMEQLKDANDQLHTVKEAFVTHKKQEEIRYQSLYQRYMKLWHKYGVAQKDMDQFQRDFVEALCMKERELDDTRISQKEAQRLYEEQKKLANQLQHKISSKLEYWDEHVCLCAENMRDNLKILHKALKENKISLMVHNLTVGLIKMMMEIPLLRLRSIFKRYIRMRHFQAAKEQMEHELKGLPDDAEHKEIANDYMRYLSRVDMRLDRRVKLWQGEMVKLEDMRRSGWKEFTDVWDGHFKGTDFTSLTEEDLFLFAMGMDRGDLFTPSPVPPSRKRKRETDSQLKHKLKGIRLPRLETGVNLVGEGMPLQGERQDMWKVKASRVKKPDTEEEDDEFKAAITTPKLTELENTQHLRSAQKTLKKQTATRRYLMSLQPAEPYDFQHQMPRPINKSFIDNVFHMDPDVDMFTLTDESSVKSTLTPRNTETANSVAEEGYSPRMTVKIRKYNLGTELGR